MPKLQSNFIEIALRHGCSPLNLLHIGLWRAASDVEYVTKKFSLKLQPWS